MCICGFIGNKNDNGSLFVENADKHIIGEILIDDGNLNKVFIIQEHVNLQ